jgi:hypothetical protein
MKVRRKATLAAPKVAICEAAEVVAVVVVGVVAEVLTVACVGMGIGICTAPVACGLSSTGLLLPSRVLLPRRYMQR